MGAGGAFYIGFMVSIIVKMYCCHILKDMLK